LVLNMRLAGLRNTSLLDFPDRISAVVFTRGCNFSCGYCHNSQLIPMKAPPGDEDLPEDIFFSFLEKRRDLLDGVTITGGEPTLQPDLKDFIVKIREKHNLQIKLDTNGTDSKKIIELLEDGLLEYIAMDVKLGLDSYPLLAPKGVIPEIKKSVELIKNSNIDYEFRATVVPGMHDEKELNEIGRIVEGAEKFFIQNFRPVNTLDPKLRESRTFAPSELKKFKYVMENYVSKVKIRN